MYFLTYEYVKKEIQAKFGTEGGKGLMGTIFAGGMAGIANWAIAMPADVLKSRLQTGKVELIRKSSIMYYNASRILLDSARRNVQGNARCVCRVDA